MIRQVAAYSFNERLIKLFECLSTDDINDLLIQEVDGISKLDNDDIGSKIFILDLAKEYTLNLDGSNLKWYETKISEVSIPEQNFKVSLGEQFQAFYKGTILAGQTLYLAYKTPIDKEVRAFPTAITPSADNLTFKYYEGAVITGGTLNTAINQNRRSGKVSSMVLTALPTVTDLGMQIAQVFLPGATGIGQTRSGNQSVGGNVPWTLKRNTVYLLAFENGSTASNTIQVSEAWIEESV